MPSQVDEEKLQQKSQANQPYNMHQPPLKNIPVMEYPRMMYLWPRDKKLAPASKTAIANDQKEEKALLAKGYRIAPHKQEFEEEIPDGFEADIPAGKAN